MIEDDDVAAESGRPSPELSTRNTQELPTLPMPAVPNTRLPMPDAFVKGSYSADQMRAYARAALASRPSTEVEVASADASTEFDVVQDGCVQHTAPTLIEAQEFAAREGPWAMSIYEVTRRLVVRNGTPGTLATPPKEEGAPSKPPCVVCCETGTDPLVNAPCTFCDGIQQCNLGVGCDEFGVCYAEAHGRPEMCGRVPNKPSDDIYRGAPDVGIYSLGEAK